MEKYTLTKKQIADLYDWYIQNRRSLPWRDTGDPYDVWLSEIMLQQTRIEAVREKFLLFRRQLPTIKALAECPDDDLMRLWEGLGYYSRARNLKKCALVLKDKYSCKLPASYKELLALPGIGPYTAGAIASIAFGEKVPAVDGNVMRVIARLFALRDDIRLPDTKTEIESVIQNVYDTSDTDASVFNQALMELGETVCLPNGQPLCQMCPWQKTCRTKKEKLFSEIPFRSPLKMRKIIERTLLIIRRDHTFLIRRRKNSGLLAGLYEFIGIDRRLTKSQALKETEKLGFSCLRIRVLPEAKHVFTHLEWHMNAYEIRVADVSDSPEGIFVSKEELQKLALPSAFKTYIDWYALREKTER